MVKLAMIGCHTSYTLNSGSAAFSISAPSSYTSGETLNIIVSFGSNSTTAKHGFELTALDAVITTLELLVPVDSNTQASNGNYIKHTSAGSSQSGNASWNVQWTAPASDGQGLVTFYAAGTRQMAIVRIRVTIFIRTTAQVSSAATTPAPSPTVLPTLPPLPSPGASPTLPPPPPTLPPLPSPVTSPTPSECEPESISTDTKKRS